MAAAYTYVLLPDTKPSIFTGNIPAFTVPHGVSFGQGIDKAWVMFASKMATQRQQEAKAEEVVKERTPRDILYSVIGQPKSESVAAPATSQQVSVSEKLAERYAGIPVAAVVEPTSIPTFVPREEDIVPDEVMLSEDET